MVASTSPYIWLSFFIAIALLGCSHTPDPLPTRAVTPVASEAPIDQLKASPDSQAGLVTPRPKYTSGVELLRTSHEFIQRNRAPDYWALSPYYIAQHTDSACSLASAAMIVNAARANTGLKADDPLVTHEELLKRVANSEWSRSVATGGTGVTLDQLKVFLLKSLKAYGFSKVDIQIYRVEKSDPESQRQITMLLERNEKSDRNFIIANFNQGTYTGDAQVGHIAPIGAYDHSRRRVLIMDPDRQWYEPYWISEEKFIEGMAARDPASGKTRGLLFIELD